MKRDLRPFLDETFSAASVGRSGLFDVAATERMWRGFLGQQDMREWSRVWSLAVLLAFTTPPGTTPPMPRGEQRGRSAVGRRCAPSR